MTKRHCDNWVIGTGLAITLITAHAQSQWVAFNADNSAAANVTKYYITGTTGGLLKNIATGANLPVGLVLTNVGAGTSGLGGSPGVATPAANVFGAYVTFGNVANNAITIPPNGLVAQVLTNLNPNKRYSVKATTVRGGSSGSGFNGYAWRWTLCQLAGALSFRAAHTSNVLTSDSMPGLLATNEAAFNSGVNTNGDLVDWEDIVPNPNGTLVLYSRMYTNAIPARYGVPGNYATNNQASYALTALRLEELDHFTFTSPPQVVTACPGFPASFTFGLSGVPPFFFQWYRTDGTTTNVIPGATNQAYTIPFAGVADAGGYLVIAGNSANSATSSVAWLTVNGNPVLFTAEPADQSGPLGSAVTFGGSVTADAAPPVSCQWYFNQVSNALSGVAIAGANNLQYTMGGLDDANAGFYYVIASNCVSAATSRVASLTVQYDPITITNQPVDATVHPGDTVTLSAGASGPRLHYQWLRATAPIPNATNTTLVLSNAQVGDSDWYTLVVSNPSHTATSRRALVVVLPVSYDVIPMVGYTWKYNQDGLDLGTNWMSPIYDDIAWPSGLGVLAHESGNANVDPYTRTVLSLTNSSGQTNITYYFRTTFVLTNDPSSVQIITTNLVDDGEVVYLNGREAYRANLSSGTLNCSALAVAMEEAVPVLNVLPIASLVEGTNYLAVEVHQAAATSPDVVMGLAARVTFSPPSPLVITNQPQSVSAREAAPANFTIRWFGGAAALQWYRTTPVGAQPIPGATLSTLTLTNPTRGVDDGGYLVIASNLVSMATSVVATLTVTQTSPFLASQPSEQALCLGDAALFQVIAYGSSSTYFQWRLNGADIPDATNACHLVPTVGQGDTGLYSVRVSNALGWTVSSNAALRIVPSDPVILQSPPSQIGQVGGLTSFHVLAKGSEHISYQWLFNDTSIPGATGPDLIIAPTKLTDEGTYCVVVSNAYGGAVAVKAELVLTMSSALNCTNLTWTIAAGTWFMEDAVTHDGVAALEATRSAYNYSATVATAVSGPGKLDFWWKFESMYTLPVFQFSLDGNGQSTLSTITDWQHQVFYVSSNVHTLAWRVYWSNWDYLMSAAAYLDQVSFTPGDWEPVILSSPTNAHVLAGTNLVFQVAAEGYPPLRYQWQHDGLDLAGATNSSLVLSNVQTPASGDYRLVVSNDYGRAKADVHLAVNDCTPFFSAPLSQIRSLADRDVILSSGAQGTDPRRCQWRFEGVDIPGATNDSLLLPGVTTNQAGHYSVLVSNQLGAAVSPDLELIVGPVTHVVHISVDGLAAKYLSPTMRDFPGFVPNFLRLQAEGSSTLNARCDYARSVTVPNHISMITGRPVTQPDGQAVTVPHGYIWDGWSTGMTIHNSGNTNVPYKASVFDVVHDHGRSTACLVSKSSLAICAFSYDANNGAPDLIPPDNGRNKIDAVLIDYTASNVVAAFLPSLTNGIPYHYAFLHFCDLDYTGHYRGWGGVEWLVTLQEMDTQLGRVLAAISTNSNPSVAQDTVVIVTADHGGYSVDHVQPDLDWDYTIPLFVWGPGFPPGTDLYSLFANRSDPGTNWVDYNQVWQPLRNGDTGNLALTLLGLPPIPGSTLIPMFPASGAALTISLDGSTLQVQWPAAARGFRLESVSDLGPDAIWATVTDQIVTNANGFRYTPPVQTGPRFYRLQK